MLVDFNTIRLLLPEIILVGGAIWLFVAGTATERSRIWWSIFTCFLYVAAGYALYRQALLPVADGSTLWTLFERYGAGLYSGPLSIDFLGHAVRWLALGTGLLFTLIVSRGIPKQTGSEFLGLLMLMMVGIMLVGSANDLVLMFLGLELISIPTYVLLFLSRQGWASSEATAKYFFLSILSSALLLYGFSFLYGLAGSTDMWSLHLDLTTNTSPNAGSSLMLLAPIALVLITAGLGFKIAAVPFHFYAPDVYQGTTNAIAGLLAVAPKIAGVVALVRLTAILLPAVGDFGWQLILTLALMTMTLGNVCALWQKNIRRLLAYSSIAHAGYMLIGLAASLALVPAGPNIFSGVSAMLMYLFIYVLATIGIFAALAHLGEPNRQVNDVDELTGLGRTRPLVGASMAIFLFSLAGIPPLAGFWGKLTLFNVSLQVAGRAEGNASLWFTVLAIVGALNAAIAAAYYLRVIAVIYFREKSSALPATGGMGAWAAMVVCALLVAILGVSPQRLVELSDMARAGMVGVISNDIPSENPTKQSNTVKSKAVVKRGPG